MAFLLTDSCPVATGQESFEQVRKAEVERFNKQLDGIIEDVHQHMNMEAHGDLDGALANGNVEQPGMTSLSGLCNVSSDGVTKSLSHLPRTRLVHAVKC